MSRLRLLSPAEASRLAGAESPGSQAAVAAPRTLHEGFRAQARRRPDAVALVGEDGVVTYGALDARAARLARDLRARGVGPETIVGVAAGRSTPLPLAILAVLKAGGAYLPLDPDYPDERLHYMLADAAPAGPGRARADVPAGPGRGSGPRARSGRGHAGPVDAGGPARDGRPTASPRPPTAEGSPGPTASPTSSTPRAPPAGPRASWSPTRNVARLFGGHRGPGSASARDDVWTLFHSPAFDFSVWELWGALLHGGRIVVVPYSVTPLAGGVRSAC